MNAKLNLKSPAIVATLNRQPLEQSSDAFNMVLVKVRQHQQVQPFGIGQVPTV